MGKRKSEPLPAGKANKKITDLFQPRQPPAQQASSAEPAAAPAPEAPTAGTKTTAGGVVAAGQASGAGALRAGPAGGHACTESPVRGEHVSTFYQNSLHIEGQYKSGHKTMLQLVNALRVEGKMPPWVHMELLLRSLDNPESSHVAIAIYYMLRQLHQTFPRVRAMRVKDQATGSPCLAVNLDSYSPAASEAPDEAGDGGKSAAETRFQHFEALWALVGRLSKGLQWLAAPHEDDAGMPLPEGAPGGGGGGGATGAQSKKEKDMGASIQHLRGRKGAKEGDGGARGAGVGGGVLFGNGGTGVSSVPFTHGIEQDKGGDHRHTSGDEVEWTELKVFGHALHFDHVAELLAADIDERMLVYRAHRDPAVLQRSAVYQLLQKAAFAKADAIDNLIESLASVLEFAGARLHESNWHLTVEDKALIPTPATASATGADASGGLSPLAGAGGQLLDDLGLPAPPGYVPERRASLATPEKGKGKGKVKGGKGHGKGAESGKADKQGAEDGEAEAEEGKKAEKAKRSMEGLLRQSKARTCVTIFRLVAKVVDLFTCLQDVKDDHFVDPLRRQKLPADTTAAMVKLGADLEAFAKSLDKYLGRLARSLAAGGVKEDPANVVLVELFLTSQAVSPELKLRFLRSLLPPMSRAAIIHMGAVDERLSEPVFRRAQGPVAKSLASLVAANMAKLLSANLHPDALALMVIHALQAGGQLIVDGNERRQYYADAERLLDAFTNACEHTKHAEGLLTRNAALHAAKICASVLHE